jgi:hypothetical protein
LLEQLLRLDLQKVFNGTLSCVYLLILVTCEQNFVLHMTFLDLRCCYGKSLFGLIILNVILFQVVNETWSMYCYRCCGNLHKGSSIVRVVVCESSKAHFGLSKQQGERKRWKFNVMVFQRHALLLTQYVLVTLEFRYNK